MSAVTTSASTIGSFTREAFESHLQSVSHLPAWWLDRKRAAYDRFESLPMPVRTDEFWRFSNLSRVTLDGFAHGAPVEFKDIIHESVGVAGAGHLVLANGRLVASEPLKAEITARGVVFDTIQNALAKHSDLVREHLLVQPARLGSEKFAALHEAFLEDGAFIHVPKGVEVELPVAVFHYAVGAGAAVFPHTLVIAGENSKITVSDFFRSSPGPEAQDPGAQFACGGNDLYAGHGSQVEYVAMQDWSRDTLSFQFNATVARRDARVLSLNLHAGGRQSRHESFSQLQAPGAHSEMLALTIAHGDQEFDQRTLQIHQAPNTSSNLLYKNALLETSKTIFSGLIIVDPDAQKTDAYQSNRNLILSDDAEANSLPGLEIQANDVRCTHGATSSRIPAEQEFYLRSRGINPALAKELIVFGFFEEIIGKITNTELHDQLAAIIRRKFKEQ
jgi:Fe-S cluster assembly protein SufD